MLTNKHKTLKPTQSHNLLVEVHSLRPLVRVNVRAASVSLLYGKLEMTD